MIACSDDGGSILSLRSVYVSMSVVSLYGLLTVRTFEPYISIPSAMISDNHHNIILESEAYHTGDLASETSASVYRPAQ